MCTWEFEGERDRLHVPGVWQDKEGMTNKIIRRWSRIAWGTPAYIERKPVQRERLGFKSSRVDFNNVPERKFLGHMEVITKFWILERKCFHLKLEERMHLYEMASGSSKIKYWLSLKWATRRTLRKRCALLVGQQGSDGFPKGQPDTAILSYILQSWMGGAEDRGRLKTAWTWIPLCVVPAPQVPWRSSTTYTWILLSLPRSKSCLTGGESSNLSHFICVHPFSWRREGNVSHR